MKIGLHLPLRTQLRAGLASAAPNEPDRKSRWEPRMSLHGTFRKYAEFSQRRSERTFTQPRLRATLAQIRCSRPN
jgi:hypothetical protein